MEISKMLTLSMAHITIQTADEMNKSVTGVESDIDLCVYEKRGYGFFIHIPDDWEDERDLPQDLQACVGLAAKNDCEWLCLDQDGPIDDLPIYEW